MQCFSGSLTDLRRRKCARRVAALVWSDVLVRHSDDDDDDDAGDGDVSLELRKSGNFFLLSEARR